MNLLTTSLAFCLCLLIVSAQAVDNEGDIKSEHPARVSTRQEETLDFDMEDRAGLVFRQLDTDFDKKVGSEDIRRGEHILKEQMPGVSVPQFIEFMEKADRDNDKYMTREEFFHALSQGLTDPSLLETGTQTTVERTGHKKAGFIGAVGNFVSGAVSNLKTAVGGVLRRITGGIDTSQDSCVMCQYIVERIETNVKASGVLAGLGSTGPSPADAFSFLQVEDDVMPAVSLVEVDQQVSGPAQAAGAAMIGSTRQATRYQRQMERQKFNEIYRVADITLDDVCEQGMPNVYYGFCKSLYKVQSDVVDGIRYQYRPQDICYRVGMCKKDAYITKGIHSRYRTDN